MASNDICESCFGKGQSTAAEKLCTDCDERLCDACADFHLGFKAFKSHHVIQLTTMPANLSSFPKYCSVQIVHDDMTLDFYCTHHSTTCCQKCIPKTHQSCINVVPLEVASKDVEKLTLFEETVTELNNICLTLDALFQDRESHLKKIRHSAFLIKHNIVAYKQRLITQIDELERELFKTLNATKTNLEADLDKTKHDITEKMTKSKHIKEELEFLRKNGTNNQLFLALHKYNQDINSLEIEITEMISRCKVTDIIFKQPTLKDLSNMVTISEQSGPCDIQYKPIKLKQAQEKSAIPSKPLTTFKPDGELQMPKGEYLNITDIAVTCDNKLLLCNYEERCPKIFIYTDCQTFENELRLSRPPHRIAVIPGTSKAVVAILGFIDNSIQFINTTTMRTEDKISVAFRPQSVTASHEKVLIGGFNEVVVLDLKGTFQKKIVIPNANGIYYLRLNKDNTELLCRNYATLYCIDLDGNLRYQYKVPNQNKLFGSTGIHVAVDGQGDVYVGDYDQSEIHRLSSDGNLKEVILTKKDGVNCPEALQFNNDFTTLFIVNSNGPKLFTFACS